ncbi:MAG TPA: hypothetical protein DC049_03420 [Spirochaetia bacterium]|nr:hypothetical protein [Spirochaetia bacterium]
MIKKIFTYLNFLIFILLLSSCWEKKFAVKEFENITDSDPGISGREDRVIYEDSDVKIFYHFYDHTDRDGHFSAYLDFDTKSSVQVFYLDADMPHSFKGKVIPNEYYKNKDFPLTNKRNTKYYEFTVSSDCFKLDDILNVKILVAYKKNEDIKEVSDNFNLIYHLRKKYYGVLP